MSKIEIKITLNDGQRLGKGAAATAFMRHLAQLGVQTDGGKVSSFGSQYKFKAKGATGVGLGTLTGVNYRPAAEPGQPGRLKISVFSDPGGFEGAAVTAGKLAERLAGAYGLELSSGTARPERGSGCVSEIPAASGLNGQFREVGALYIP
jgi:hypothetical protein